MISFYDPYTAYDQGFRDGVRATIRHARRKPRIHAYIQAFGGIGSYGTNERGWEVTIYKGARWHAGDTFGDHQTALEWALKQIKEAKNR